jgi:hypothetical protein
VSGHDGKPPLYVRVLRLKHIHPSGLMCILLFEGVIGLAILLSLAELVNWLAVLVLPTIVAALVKINDVVAGAFTRVSVSEVTTRFATRRQLGEARGTASVPRRRQELDLESPTQALPLGHQRLDPDEEAPEPKTRAARRRATNQRRFAPANGAEGQKNGW